MSRLEVILSVILFFSVVFNIGLAVYLRGVLVRLLFISEELGDFQQMVNSFANHLKQVYELEMFYGDQTLQHLLEHAVSFNEQLDTFEYIYTLTEVEGESEPYDEQEPVTGEDTDTTT